jgi:hypothetical protein
MSVSFRLTGKLYSADSCICLYRGMDAEALTTCQLFLTKDRRFAYLARVIGGKGMYAAEEWGHDRAMRFLLAHGEGDLVDEFPDIFRKRAVIEPARKNRSVGGGKDRPAEPLLFPLH